MPKQINFSDFESECNRAVVKAITSVQGVLGIHIPPELIPLAYIYMGFKLSCAGAGGFLENSCGKSCTLEGREEFSPEFVAMMHKIGQGFVAFPDILEMIKRQALILDEASINAAKK